MNIKKMYSSNGHCVKSFQIRSFSGPLFPVFGQNTGKYGPEKTPYLDNFHAVGYNKQKVHEKFAL